MRDSPPQLTVGITTRNRPESLRRCVESLRHIDHLAPEILVFDDASEIPAAETLKSHTRVRIIRNVQGPGNIVGRNTLVRTAGAATVLLLDDDAALLDGPSVERAIAIIRTDGQVGAVAFAQANADGTSWPEEMQPGRGQAPRYVPAFIGFAHLLNRDVFVDLGGYRETFVFYGEEKEYCLRLLDRGYRVVYLPDALVVHAQDAAGRSPQRYLRYVTRNDCLHALYNEPMWRAMWLVPARLALYFRMRSQWKVDDPAGLRWILSELAASAGPALRTRRPVSRQTRASWRRLRDGDAPYTSSATRLAPVPAGKAD
ncbi:MAG: glycosyltransferase family 2 protein [Vicinamibacterales bacterium]